MKSLVRLLAKITTALLRLLGSILIGIIVGLLAIAYLNARGARRDTIARLMLAALGEQPQAVEAPTRVQQEAHGGFSVIA